MHSIKISKQAQKMMWQQDYIKLDHAAKRPVNMQMMYDLTYDHYHKWHDTQMIFEMLNKWVNRKEQLRLALF